MTFDEQVKSLRGKVVPKCADKKKANCTPAEWAANLDYLVEWKRSNKDKSRAWSVAWNKANPERHRATNKTWSKANREKVRAADKAWRKANPEKARAAEKAWKKANPEKYRASQRKTQNKRAQNDPVFRMVCALRSRQNKFFKGKTRSLSVIRDMGCDPEFFGQHIASQFTAGMTMENYGKFWHLDHIYPLAAADIVNNRIHFLAVANWRNIQPMLGPENVEKKDKVTPEAQVLFDALCQEFLAHATQQS